MFSSHYQSVVLVWLISAFCSDFYFKLHNGANSGYKGIVLLYRGEAQNVYTHYTDVHVCGNQRIYDNGISVAGFRWKETGPKTRFTGNSGIESMRYSDENIECKASAVPQYGTWGKSGIVYNTNHSNSVAMWIYLPASATKWVARR